MDVATAVALVVGWAGSASRCTPSGGTSSKPSFHEKNQRQAIDFQGTLFASTSGLTSSRWQTVV